MLICVTGSQIGHSMHVQDLKLVRLQNEHILTRSATIRALAGVPTPTAMSFTPAESNLSLVSLKTEANSQLGGKAEVTVSPKKEIEEITSSYTD
jgi:hypothetical protein